MMQRIALDENLHMIFYRNTLKAALDLEPNAAMRAIADVVTNFDMPDWTTFAHVVVFDEDYAFTHF